MTVSGNLSTGEPVVLRSFDGQAIELVTERAFAPGARAVMSFEVGGAGLGVEVKCHGSRKTDEGGFLVRGRVISMRREHRDALLSALEID